MIRWDRIQDYLFPLATTCCLLVLLLPLPTHLMDVLLAANVLFSVLILYTSVYIKTPLEFSMFPTVLLVATLARLVLNIATTRLILVGGGRQGLDAAGGVVRTFGEFVSGDNLLVGMVIFGIILVVQFVVITKGATRISEVAARFSLDALPGRQMAIDADLTSGAINDAEAQRRRDELAFQADFFAAMDGASKFVRGDAIAGLVITVINLAGGLVVGVGQSGMSVGQATSVFSKLTIGDGLVSQLPALAISMAAAILVTRSSRRTDLARDMVRQLGTQPQVLAFSGCLLLTLLLTPLPKLPLLGLGLACLVAAGWQGRRAADVPAARPAESRPTKSARKEPPRVEDYLAIDPVELELGVGLVRLVDASRGGNLLEEVSQIRQEIAREIGIVVPKVRVRDNMALHEHQYRIKIAGNPVADGTFSAEEVCAELSEESGPRPVRLFASSGPPVPWSVYASADVARIRQSGGHVLGTAEVITRHLRHVVRWHAHELLTRDATKHLLDELRKTAPAVVDELVPSVMKVGDVQRTLQALLIEGVPVRQLGLILETLGDHADQRLSVEDQVELVRSRLARTLCSRYCDRANRLHVVTLSPELEQRLSQNLLEGHANTASFESLSELMAGRLEPYVRRLRQMGRAPVVLVERSLRRLVHRMVNSQLPDVVVLSHDEVTADTKVTSVGIASLAGPMRAAA